jgi:hypothetical protein
MVYLDKNDKSQYFVQTDNSSVSFFQRYFGRAKYVDCGPTCDAMGLAITGNDMDVFTPNAQPEDIIQVIYQNPKNMEYFLSVRDLDLTKWPPNEIPQYAPVVTELIYGEPKCEFSWKLGFSECARRVLDLGQPIKKAGKFNTSGHFVLIVGASKDGETLYMNDPYYKQWPDNIGWRRPITRADWKKWKISEYGVFFYNPDYSGFTR